MIEVEVVYATAEYQLLRTLSVREGMSVRAVLVALDVADEFPGLSLDSCPVGIFGKVIVDPDNHAVKMGDRIEVYRPLLADPKEIRRLRAAKAAQSRNNSGR